MQPDVRFSAEEGTAAGATARFFVQIVADARSPPPTEGDVLADLAQQVAAGPPPPMPWQRPTIEVTAVMPANGASSSAASATGPSRDPSPPAM